MKKIIITNIELNLPENCTSVTIKSDNNYLHVSGQADIEIREALANLLEYDYTVVEDEE